MSYAYGIKTLEDAADEISTVATMDESVDPMTQQSLWLIEKALREKQRTHVLVEREALTRIQERAYGIPRRLAEGDIDTDDLINFAHEIAERLRGLTTGATGHPDTAGAKTGGGG